MRQDRGEEIWLRGNVRPVLGLAAVAAASAAILAAGLALAGAGARTWGMWGAGCSAVAALALCLGQAATRPRLSRHGGLLRVRLAPLATHEVPLEVVECVFPGSQPVGGATDPSRPSCRVGTMVVRLAERAEAWRERPTFGPWGSWRDGTIAFDGRWCEPLPPEKIRTVAARLIELKRELAADVSPGGSP